MDRLIKISLLASSLLLVTGTGALADQINGNWCAVDGQRISIDGPHVVTPAGNRVVANYDRHHIDYVIPQGEPGAGGRFVADQLSDEKISVKTVTSGPAKSTTSEIWTPCKPTV